jgi:hypothetical protein
MVLADARVDAGAKEDEAIAAACDGGQVEVAELLLVSPASGLGELRALRLRSSKLTALPESHGQLTSIDLMMIWRCSSLGALPESQGQLASLQGLIWSGCSSLVALPEWSGQLVSLERVDLSECSSLARLPESMGALVSLLRAALARLLVAGSAARVAGPAGVAAERALEGLFIARSDSRIAARAAAADDRALAWQACRARCRAASPARRAPLCIGAASRGRSGEAGMEEGRAWPRRRRGGGVQRALGG